jgi:hypothetical protein
MKKMLFFLALTPFGFGQLPSGPLVNVACTPRVHGLNIANPVCFQQAAVAPAPAPAPPAPKPHVHRAAAPVATTRSSLPQVSPAEIEAAAARGTARGMAEGIAALKAAFPAPAALESAPTGVDENRVRTIAREEADKSASAVLDLAAAADRKATEALSQARRGSALAEQIRAIMAQRGTRGEKKAARKINGVIQTPSQ